MWHKFPWGGVLLNYLDDTLPVGTETLGCEVIGKIEDCVKYPDAQFVIAVGDNKARKEIADKYDLTYISVIHPTAVIAEDVKIKVGTVVMANAVINPSAVIGRHCIVNTGAIVEHDNVIEDYVHISPGAHLAGMVSVGEGVWIGIGASVSNNVNLTSGCIVGAGTVVVKDIKESGTYVGVPARKLD